MLVLTDGWQSGAAASKRLLWAYNSCVGTVICRQVESEKNKFGNVDE